MVTCAGQVNVGKDKSAPAKASPETEEDVA